MARTPKPLRRWKRKAFRALGGGHNPKVTNSRPLKQRLNRSGRRIRIGGESFRLSPRSLRLYR